MRDQNKKKTKYLKENKEENRFLKEDKQERERKRCLPIYIHTPLEKEERKGGVSGGEGGKRGRERGTEGEIK